MGEMTADSTRGGRLVASSTSTTLSEKASNADEIVAKGVHAWFSGRLVLKDVDLVMESKKVTALIGPSGCGKSTFLRILNRMHETIPGAELAGSVELGGQNLYDPSQRATDVRRRIGMVFQRPNPFPAMSIEQNVMSGLRFNRVKPSNKHDVIEEALTKAGLWTEVKDRLNNLGGALSGGQQQRLCIARALAIRPTVLLMDEPCSALDPASTLRIEQTVGEIKDEVTVVIVTHNMQQANRVSDNCAFFLSENGSPGHIVEANATKKMFSDPEDPRTLDYVNGRFG